MNSSLKKCLGRRKMQVIWRNDRDGLNAVFAGSLLHRHLGKACIYSVLGQPKASTGFLSQGRIGGQSSRNQFIIVVNSRCNSVDVADEGSDPATDHSQSNPRRRARLS